MNAPHTRLPTQKSVGSVAIGGAASRGRSVPLGLMSGSQSALSALVSGSKRSRKPA